MIATPAFELSDPAVALEHVHDELRSGSSWMALDRLFTALRSLRGALEPDDWIRFRRHELVHLPIFHAVREDPMVRRSYDKPRGYPGDAVLLDYIYRLREPEHATALGRSVWDHCTSTRPAALAVQARRRVMARCLDELCERPEGYRRALAVAAGHFREGALSRGVRNGALDEVVALDSDADSLAEVARSFPEQAVRIEHRSATRLLQLDDDLGAFDLIYSSGLYDYLDRRLATRLTMALFSRLAPGGRLVLCNFVPQIYDAGFMEAVMGWELIFRSENELRALAAEVPREELGLVRVWTDPFDAVAYLSVERRRPR